MILFSLKYNLALGTSSWHGIEDRMCGVGEDMYLHMLSMCVCAARDADSLKFTQSGAYLSNIQHTSLVVDSCGTGGLICMTMFSQFTNCVS